MEELFKIVREEQYEYWQNIKQSLITENKIVKSNFLLKLKQENSEVSERSIPELEYLITCCVKLCSKISKQYPAKWIENFYDPNREFFKNLLTLFKFPKEKTVIFCLEFINSELINHKIEIIKNFSTAEEVMKRITLLGLNLFKSEYDSADFNLQHINYIKNSYALIDPEQRNSYLILFYQYASKIFNKLMVIDYIHYECTH